MSIVTMPQLGNHGRFGNQLYQYAFLKIYCEQHGAELQIPPWVGNTLFGTSDPPVSVQLPHYEERHTGPNWMDPKPPVGDELLNHDFRGYAQYQTKYYWPHRGYIQRLFEPRPEIRERLAGVGRGLAYGHSTSVGIHLRRGDYGRQIFYITPVEWYLRKLEEIWPTLVRPRLFVATEDRSLVDEFAAYNPITTDDLGVTLDANEMKDYGYLPRDRAVRDPWQLDFYPDFYALTMCDYLLMPNSSFSFVAAMLNPFLQKCWRSDLPTQSFVEIDPWDAKPLTDDKAEDWDHIEGVCLRHNPYWE